MGRAPRLDDPRHRRPARDRHHASGDGVFFATQRLTHLRVDQFFGIAFWIGFTTTYLAGELYLRKHPVAETQTTSISLSS